MKNIDLYDNYYDDHSGIAAMTSSYPKFVSWKNPEDGEFRQRVLRNDSEHKMFFEWFLNKYPEIKYTVD